MTEPVPPPRRDLTVEQIASRCSVEPAVVLQWIQRQGLKYTATAEGQVQVEASVLEAFLKEQTEGSVPNADLAAAKYRVLLVEDDEDLLELLRDLLREDPRLDVRTEVNGFNALLQIAGWRPDLVVLDFMIPGLNGFEICRRARTDVRTLSIPILALTSLAGDENRQAIFESGATDFLKKPFYSGELIRRVLAHLGVGPL